MKILVVDDSKAVHAFTKGVFAGTSVSLTHVFDGSEAVALLSNPAAIFDLILLDWEMPVLTGPETLVRLRASGNQTPIIMVTTKNDLASITSALENGANEYVMKPYTKDILIAKISNVIGKEVA